MNKIKISAVVNTRNEEANIVDCLKQLSFCSEIVIVDMESEDNTVALAKEYTHKVFSHKNVGFVEPARNFAISKAVGDWILIVDADERVPKTLAKQLQSIAETAEFDFVRVPRQNLVFGSWLQHSRWWPDYNIRFFKKGTVNWQDEIHSVPVTTGKGFNLPAESGYSLIHHHYKSLDEYLIRTMRYANQQAKELIDSGYKLDLKDFIVKPISEFNSRFFAGEGYKDGVHGFILSLLQFFAILLIYLKVWEKAGFPENKTKKFFELWTSEGAKMFSEIRFWYLTALIQNTSSKVRAFILKARRKLKV